MPLERHQVVGDHEIVGADGKGVRKPGVVELDSDVINIAALYAAGHLGPADEPAAKAGKAKPAGEGATP